MDTGTGLISPVAGSRRKREALVRCEAVKKIPLGFQSWTDLFSSKEAASSFGEGVVAEWSNEKAVVPVKLGYGIVNGTAIQEAVTVGAPGDQLVAGGVGDGHA